MRLLLWECRGKRVKSPTPRAAIVKAAGSKCRRLAAEHARLETVQREVLWVKLGRHFRVESKTLDTRMENPEVCIYIHGLNLTVCLPASLYSGEVLLLLKQSLACCALLALC